VLIFSKSSNIMLNIPKKYLNYLCLVSVIVLAAACSNTPNNVTMNQAQGQCVQLSQYQSSVQASVLAAFPVIATNPKITTPYCMSVTIQNNNAGTNANNIEIVSTGLQVSTTPPGSASSITAALYDPAAANVGVLVGESQTIANVALFDPNNCATSTGANVKVLSTGGGLCTFYLQILNESSPVGVYPYSITYNYGNGNQSYAVNTTVNQRVYLYGGDNFSQGLYFMSTNAMTAAAAPTTTIPIWQNGLPGSPAAPVQYIIEAPYGFVDFAAYQSVYYYNGITVTPIGSALPISPSVVLSLASDPAGNIYAATNGKGMWVYNISAASPAWVQMTDSNGNINANSTVIGLKGFEFSTFTTNVLYEVTESQAFQCTPNAALATESCTSSVIASPLNPFFPNAFDVDNNGNLYAGGANSGNLAIAALSSNLIDWNLYSNISPVLPYTPDQTRVGGVRWTNLNGTTNLFFGAVNESAAESTVYSCAGNNCTPLISSADNPIAGSAVTLTTDGTGNLYVGGSGLLSSDYSPGTAGSTTTGAFLLFGPFAATGVGAGTWTPILQIESTSTPLQINATAVASMLTSY
jgi:hypothetical protein